MPKVRRVVQCPAFPDMRDTEYAFVDTDCAKCSCFGGDPGTEMLADLRQVPMRVTDYYDTLSAALRALDYVVCSLEMKPRE